MASKGDAKPDLMNILDDAAKDFNKKPAEEDRPKRKASQLFENILNDEAGELGDLLAQEFQDALNDVMSAGANENENQMNSSNVLFKAVEEMSKNMSDASANFNPTLNDDFIKNLIGDNSPEGGKQFDDMLSEFLSTLLDKDVLYPSLKELDSKYSDWLKANVSTLSSDIYSNYSKQCEIISKMCVEYEKLSPDSDESLKSKVGEEIISYMQSLQALGNPPEELMSQLTLGVEGKLPFGTSEQCSIM